MKFEIGEEVTTKDGDGLVTSVKTGWVGVALYDGGTKNYRPKTVSPAGEKISVEVKAQPENLFQFIGDTDTGTELNPRDPQNPQEIFMYGTRFTLNGNPQAVSDEAAEKLSTNSHFKKV